MRRFKRAKPGAAVASKMPQKALFAALGEQRATWQARGLWTKAVQYARQPARETRSTRCDRSSHNPHVPMSPPRRALFLWAKTIISIGNGSE